ncbi:hypothetical protein FA15DRAFT_607913 [Coprinopsis marcescibilis]|uniref:Uncharacterized protein n=1 Tax=Coprinopsis marcescibilis TaxID=230819 RepID=A0A5C3LCG2_COPMA|nr:hypothetical protein FA15DRAFT_607913 [Coprinopsis marcescibilis]
MSAQDSSSGFDKNRLQPSRHVPKPSIDTNASGLAESTISYSQFPPPPSEIPLTPIRGSSSTTSSPAGTPVISTRPLVPRKGPPSAKSQRSIAEPSARITPKGSPRIPTGPYRPHGAQPHPTTSASDWHDGASSIDVDPDEARLLPTSFITSLLQENKELRRANRKSYASDAFSGISEMTYPPPVPYYREDLSRAPSTSRHAKAAYRAAGRAPPSAFAPIRENNSRMSSDSETLHSMQGHSSMGRNVNLPRSAGADGPTVVGIASATLRSIASSSRPESMQTVPMSISDEKEIAYGLSNQSMDDDSIMRFKAQADQQPPPSLAPPPYATHRRFRNTAQPGPTPEIRQSVHSVAPSFVSRLSMPASVRRLFNWRKKPLPPVPRIPDISLAMERQTRRAEESAPLPELATRAEALHTMLEKGYQPHHSISSYSELQAPNESHHYPQDTMGTYDSSKPLRPLYYSDFAMKHEPEPDHLSFGDGELPPNTSCCARISKRTWIAIAIFVTAAIAGIIAAAVVVAQRNQAVEHTCPPRLAGISCNLDSTCVCTGGAQCNALARNIIDLIPAVNEVFSTNFTASDIYTGIWFTQGSPLQNNCSPQSQLVDVGTGLNREQYPVRARWTQAALLWNVVMAQDPQSAENMQKFVYRAPWNTLTTDGPTNVNEGSFTAQFSGHVFNFATQTWTYPTASFASQGQTASEQISRVGSTAQSALDRAYTFAQASSSQREIALRNYWTTILSQRSEDLPAFKAIVADSQILLPFNASSSSIRDLFSNSSTSVFPPPIACYPDLSSTQLDRIRSMETSVFQLSAHTEATEFDRACYEGRPIYGVLDILALRLPFLDSRNALPRQAAILRREVASRAVLYAGETLSGTFPGTPAPSFNASQLNPRRFGTINLPNHVLLEYLSSMPVPTAVALVQFVLSSRERARVPPEQSSPLTGLLPSIPVLEVAVFGSIGPSDVQGVVSSFTTRTGPLFFGSDAGASMRRWAVSSYGRAVHWTESATSPRILKDTSLEDATLSETWDVARRLGLDSPDILARLLTSLHSTGKLSTT